MNPASSNESNAWRPRRIAIVGVGLLGGSVGLAIQRAWPDVTVVGVSRRESVLQQACEMGAITEGGSDLREACRDADVVVIAVPVDQIAELVLEVSQLCASETLITDVGSTKVGIVHRVLQDPDAAQCFVGAHPIAGGEKAGVGNARADLFDGRTVVITPTSQTPAQRTSEAVLFWKGVGAKVLSVAPELHDDMLAATSHVPHLIAALLVTSLPDNSQPFLGTGWRDSTRIAAGSPEVWTAICRENADSIVNQLEHFRDGLEKLLGDVRSGRHESIDAFLTQASRQRSNVFRDDLGREPHG